MVTLSASELTPITCLNLEPRAEKEKRPTEKHVTPQSGSKCQGNGIQLETIGDISLGPECRGSTIDPSDDEFSHFSSISDRLAGILTELSDPCFGRVMEELGVSGRSFDIRSGM